MTVYAELSKVLKSKYTPGDDLQRYLQDLTVKADKLDDKAWDKLSAKAQQWVNDAIGAIENKDEIPLPDGLEIDEDEDEDEDYDEDDNVVDTADEDDDDDVDEDEDESDEEEDTDEEEDEEEDEAPPPRKAMKNGKNGKHTVKVEAKARGRKAKAAEAEEKVTKGRGGKGKAAKAEKPAKVAKTTKPVKEVKGKGKVKGKAAKAAEKPAKAAKPRKTGGGGKRQTPFPENAKIRIINKNPHREGSKIAERYAKLKNGMTCAEARAAGLSWLDLRCDVDRGNIEIK